jgi:serine/threonine-protein phosphatase 2A regulatory subunit A
VLLLLIVVCQQVKKLSAGDWFTSQVSACGLYAAAYRVAATAEGKQALRAQFEQLAKDDTPMVCRLLLLLQ